MFYLILTSVLTKIALCDELVSVVVIYRHGDRTPTQPYPTDPYKNASYWPVGFGELTNLGKMQQYQLGKWLRSRYSAFLSPRYSENDFYIISTDVDRTLMSAEANLAGLYPPKDDQVWDPAIPWQPIPIHTTPELQDNLLAMKKNCPKYDFLMNRLFQTEYFVNISHQIHDLYAYVTKNTGSLIDSLEKLEYLYSTLFIENLYNFTLPDWTKKVYPDELKPWAELSFATPTWTPDLQRLKTGPLFNEIIRHFLNATRNVTNFRKFLVFSAHDLTISSILNTLGAFQYHCPPYTSTVIFELRRTRPSGYYLNVFYKNSSQIQNITLKGCDFNCDFDDFIEILKPITISTDQWDSECQFRWLHSFRLDNLQIVIYLTATLVMFVVVLTTCWLIKCCKKMPKGGVTAYMQLPIDDVA